MPNHAVESMALLASLNSLSWDQIAIADDLIQFIGQVLHDFNEKSTSHFADEFLIQIVAACGLFAGQQTKIATKILNMSKDLIKLLNSEFFGTRV